LTFQQNGAIGFCSSKGSFGFQVLNSQKREKEAIVGPPGKVLLSNGKRGVKRLQTRQEKIPCLSDSSVLLSNGKRGVKRLQTRQEKIPCLSDSSPPR
jgi:hypothetical protein